MSVEQQTRTGSRILLLGRAKLKNFGNIESILWALNGSWLKKWRGFGSASNILYWRNKPFTISRELNHWSSLAFPNLSTIYIYINFYFELKLDFLIQITWRLPVNYQIRIIQKLKRLQKKNTYVNNVIRVPRLTMKSLSLSAPVASKLPWDPLWDPGVQDSLLSVRRNDASNGGEKSSSLISEITRTHFFRCFFDRNPV
jgi:hypothetical protein